MDGLKMIKTWESEIEEVKQLTPTCKHIRLTLPEGKVFIPGQFVSVIFEHEGKTLRRPYSIASSPKLKESIECIIKIVEGPGSQMIESWKPGDKANLIGPMGPFTLKDLDRTLCFISTGTGIGPFRSMINDLLENGHEGKIILIAGYRSEEDVLYTDEFMELAKNHNNFEYQETLSQPINPSYKGEKGYVQEIVERNIPKDFKGDFYLCGLFKMIKETATLLAARNMPQNNIYFERYD